MIFFFYGFVVNFCFDCVCYGWWDSLLFMYYIVKVIRDYFYDVEILVDFYEIKWKDFGVFFIGRIYGIRKGCKRKLFLFGVFIIRLL